MHPQPSNGVAYIPSTVSIVSLLDVLPLEMWVSVRGGALEVVVHHSAKRAPVWRTLAQSFDMRVRRWHWLFGAPLDDNRVGFDLLTERGVLPSSLWTPGGPKAALRFFTLLDFALPNVVLGEPDRVDPILALYPHLGRPAPFIFPASRLRYVRRAGRHDLLEWLKARGGPGARLLALRIVGADAGFDPDPAFLASLDMRLRRIARLGAFTRGATPSAEQRTQWSDLIQTGQMLAHLSTWLNDAERARDRGTPIDFALPRLLGLSQTAQLRIIP